MSWYLWSVDKAMKEEESKADNLPVSFVVLVLSRGISRMK